MDVMTIKQYAESKGISYEAVRKQLVRYADELEGHVLKQGRTQYLDDFAVEFLSDRRRQSPIVVTLEDRGDEIERLNERIAQLTAQTDALKTELINAQKHVIDLQNDNTTLLEAKLQYSALLQDNQIMEERLRAAEEKQDELSQQVTAAELRANEAEKARDEASRQRDEAQQEADSYQKTWFGFYRKI